LYQSGNNPKKNIHFEIEKTLTHFSGRAKPNLQVGEHTNRGIPLSFYCTSSEYETLEALTASKKILMLRDARFGVLYGTIMGALAADWDDTLNGCVVSFTFTEADYRDEVDII